MTMLTNQNHEELYQDLAKLIDKYSAKLTKPEILAVAANIVGKLIALQDQRTMTREKALLIVGKNMERGNADVINRLAATNEGTKQ